VSDALRGTVAIVTGASSGIGEATAEALSGEGATVVLAARRADRLEELAARLGPSTLAVPTDLADVRQASVLVERTVERFGRLDVLVNNAGVMPIGPVLGSPLEEWQAMVDLNVTALMACTHTALPHLVEAAASGPRQVADIVNVSSVAGRKVSPGGAVYSATKYAVGAFSEGLRQELATRRVRVTVVEPGLTDTELTHHIRPEVLAPMQAALDQMPSMGANDVAAAIVFAVTRPPQVAVNDLVVRPTMQER
jgi:NADP-dependent 3-hydroxy acid dehydrogenase YdfG